MFVLLVLTIAPTRLVASDPPQVSIEKYGDEYVFRIGSEVVTRYHTRSSHAKPFLQPLIAAGGVHVTRDWPVGDAWPGDSLDHPHQKSAWFGHGDVIPEGVQLTTKSRGARGIDFWAEAPGCGKIHVTSVDIMPPAPGKAALRSRNAWKSAEGRVFLDEVRTITLVPRGDDRLIIVRISLKPSGSPVTFGDTKEGAFAVRMSDALSVKKSPASQITNSAGNKGEKECWGVKANWCDYSGSIDGKKFGVAIFEDATNRTRACWHVRDYGLLAANPFGRKDSGFPAQKDSTEPPYLMGAKDELKLRYAIYVHAGDAESAKVAAAYKQFQSLPD